MFFAGIQRRDGDAPASMNFTLFRTAKLPRVA